MWEVERKARSSGEERPWNSGPARHYAGILEYQKFHKRLIPFTINKKKKTIEASVQRGIKGPYNRDVCNFEAQAQKFARDEPPEETHPRSYLYLAKPIRPTS